MERPLMMPSNTALIGRAATDGFVFTWADTKPGGYYIGNADPVNGNTNITLRGLTITGAGDGLPAGQVSGAVALSFRRGTGLYLIGLTITNAPSIAIAYQGFSHVRISGNTISGSGRDGITGWWYGTPMKDVWITGNRISRMGDDGIAVNASAPENPNRAERPSGIRITDNMIEGHRSAYPELWGRGILVLGAEDVLIQGNAIVNAAASGVLVAADENPASAGFSSRNIRVLKNTIRGSGRYGDVDGQPRNGIFVASSSDLAVNGNVITDSTEDGMLISGARDAMIAHNTVVRNGTLCGPFASHVGISIVGVPGLPTQRISVDSNAVRGSASNGIRVRGAQGVAIRSNAVADNGVFGDSRTPLSAGIWVYNCEKGYLVQNRVTQGPTAPGVGRHSWGVIARCLAAEKLRDRVSNTSAGAAVGGLFIGTGRQASLDLWQA